MQQSQVKSRWTLAWQQDSYQRLTGKLIYLSHTIPDIACVVSGVG